MEKAKNFSPSIPKDYKIYESGLEVVGIQFRKDAAQKFVRGSEQALELEREQNNKHDPNAIKVIGISKGLFFTSRNFVGYIPKEISKQIVGSDLWGSVKPRLRRIYAGGKDFVEIQFQLIGPKDKKEQYDGFLKNKPATQIQKEFYKFFSLKVPKGLTTGQAEEFIKNIKKEFQLKDTEKLEDWDYYEEICNEFDDSGFRETYEIKKVSLPLLRDAVNKLVKDGETLCSLSENIDKVVNKVISMKPDIEMN